MCQGNIGYPENFGAVPDDITYDCRPAIEACIAAHPVTVLGAHDYYVSGPVRITDSYRTLQGVNARIVSTSPTGDVLHLGPGTNPGDWGLFLQNVTISQVTLGRAVPPAPPASDDELNAPTGCRMTYTRYCTLRNVVAEEHSVGFLLSGTIKSTLTECIAVRRAPGASSENDFFWGFLQDGYASIGSAGGNASTYYTDCLAHVEGPAIAAGSIGFYLRGAPADTYLLRPETAVTGSGIKIVGSETTSGDGNVHILGAVVDRFTIYGLSVLDMGPYTSLTCIDGYFAPAATASELSAGIRMVNSSGCTSLTNNRLVGWPAPAAVGVKLVTCAGVRTQGNQVLGSLRPVDLLACGNIFMQDSITAPVALPGQKAAISAADCARLVLEPLVTAVPGAFPAGVALLNTTASEVRVSGLDASGMGHKLISDGAVVASEGHFGPGGTNLAQGNMG